MAEPALFRLGIIGGCLTHQAGIAMSDLYHRRLADRLEAEAGIRLRPHIARSFTQDHATRLDWLLGRHQLDGVLLHVRVAVMKRARLMVQVAGPDGVKLRLHPALLDRRHHGDRIVRLRAADDAGENDMAQPGRDLAGRAGQFDRPRSRRRRARLALRRLNAALGALAGLERWAADDDIVMLEEFARVCRDRDVPVFILGPTPLLDSPLESRAPRRVEAGIRSFSGRTGVSFALIGDARDERGGPHVKRDAIHMTPAGHAYVAERLFDAGIGAWMTSILDRPDGDALTLESRSQPQESIVR